MRSYSSFARLLAAVVLTVLVAGCIGSTSQAQAGAQTAGSSAPPRTVASIQPVSVPSASPTTSPSAIPGPIVHGPVMLVVGKHFCKVNTGTQTTDDDGAIHFRGGTLQCTDEVNDPRVSGTYTGTWLADAWGSPYDGALVQWGQVRMENDGGTWEGRLRGVYSSDLGDTLMYWWTGTGGYAGLTYFALIRGSTSPWTIEGQIYPGAPPTP